jgi:hypothetical protein
MAQKSLSYYTAALRPLLSYQMAKAKALKPLGTCLCRKIQLPGISPPDISGFWKIKFSGIICSFCFMGCSAMLLHVSGVII